MNSRDPVESIAELVRRSDVTVAVAESLTCGTLAATLGKGPDASTWLRGGVVAYATGVKNALLGVSPGPVVTARCAEEMATGVLRLLQSEVAVSTTGVGGPTPEEGRPAGTVFIGWATPERSGSVERAFDGDPAEVLDQTVGAAIDVLATVLTGGDPV